MTLVMEVFLAVEIQAVIAPKRQEVSLPAIALVALLSNDLEVKFIRILHSYILSIYYDGRNVGICTIFFENNYNNMSVVVKRAVSSSAYWDALCNTILEQVFSALQSRKICISILSQFVSSSIRICIHEKSRNVLKNRSRFAFIYTQYTTNDLNKI